MKDRRGELRMEAMRPGQIAGRNLSHPLDCIVYNLSLTGACLEIAGANEVPETFELSFHNDPNRHLCRVVWRTGDRIGIEFYAG